jgi:methylmalonyl-CoA mutase
MHDETKPADASVAAAGIESQDGPLLRDEFAGHSYEQWRAAAEKLLKGAPFDKKLKTPLDEGFTLDPIYRKEDIAGLTHLGQLPGQGSHVRGRTADGYLLQSWVVSQELPLSEPEAFNQAAREDLGRGQDEVNIVLSDVSGAGVDADKSAEPPLTATTRGGLVVSTLAQLDAALAEIDLQKTPIFLQPKAAFFPAATLLLAHAAKKNTALRGCLGCDPLAALASSGALLTSAEQALDQLVGITRWAQKSAPELQTICVSSTPYAEAGAHAAQELGYTLCGLVTYLERLTDAGLAIDALMPRVRLSLSLGSNVFMEIAKLRAARHLVAKIAAAFGASENARSLHLHARSTQYNKTLFDPHVNMLRATTEAFSGVVGGVDSLHVSPYDSVFALPDEFSRRTARNTQLVLANEHDLRQVVDPAGGSYYVEWLTDKLARAAWELLQKTQAGGGLLAVLLDGSLAAAIEETESQRKKALARRKRVLVGTNLYANTSEKAARSGHGRALSSGEFALASESLETWRAQRDAQALEQALSRLSETSASEPASVDVALAAINVGATLGDLSAAIGQKSERAQCQPLCKTRLAESFEALRQKVMAAGQDGKAPSLMQVNIGPSRLYRARADWTSGFFQVAGFDVQNTTDFEDEKQALAAAVERKASLVVITSTDETYESVVPSLAAALHRELPSCHVMVAGAARDEAQMAAWKEAGVDLLVNARVDVLATLEGLLGQIGAQA